MRVIFTVAGYVSILGRNAEISYRITSGDYKQTGGSYTPDDTGQCEVADIKLPNGTSQIIVYLDQEEGVKVYASCNIAPNRSRRLHILIDPVADDVPVTETNRESRAVQGGSTTAEDSVTGKVGVTSPVISVPV